MNVVPNSFTLCKVSSDFVYNDICALNIVKALVWMGSLQDLFKTGVMF